MVERPSAWVKALAHFLDIPEPRPPADKIMPMATGSSIEFNRFAATYEEALVNATAKRSGLGERLIDEFSKPRQRFGKPLVVLQKRVECRTASLLEGNRHSCGPKQMRSGV